MTLRPTATQVGLPVLLTTALLTAALLVSPAAEWLGPNAQAAEPAAADQQSKEQDPDKGDDQQKSADSDAKSGTDGGFLPSEEISEDFAVSFPVDI